MSTANETRTELATIGGGCFWCIEAVYKRIDGIKSAVSGYAGGATENPNYREVSMGNSGHAEVVQVAFDPDVISYEKVLKVFFDSHDPTTENRQGADVGTQYRSIVLYHDDAQREVAERVILETREKYTDPIVTSLKQLETFYEAEDYHQDYFENNRSAGYCRIVIAPKLEKLGLDAASLA